MYDINKIKRYYECIFGKCYHLVYDALKSHHFSEYLCTSPEESANFKKMHHLFLSDLREPLKAGHVHLNGNEYDANIDNSYPLAQKIRNNLGDYQGLSIGFNPWLDNIFHENGEWYCELKDKNQFSPVVIIGRDWYPLIKSINKQATTIEYPFVESIRNDNKYWKRLIHYGLANDEKFNNDTQLIYLNAIPFLRNGYESSGDNNIQTNEDNKFYALCFEKYLKPLLTALKPRLIVTWGEASAEIVSIDRIDSPFWDSIKHLNSDKVASHCKTVLIEGFENIDWLADYHPSSCFYPNSILSANCSTYP